MILNISAAYIQTRGGFGKLKKFLNRITDISVTRPKLTIIISILFILACGYLVRYTKMTLDPTEDLPESLPEKIFYEEVKEMFASRDFILIAIETESIFDKTVIKDIYSLSEELKTVKGVYSVSSIASLQILSGDEENIFIDKPFVDDRLPETTEEIGLFKQKIINSGLPLENIISKDGEATAIMVMLKKSADEPQVISDIDTILLNTKISEKYTTHLVGEPVTDLYSSMLIGKNMQRLFPLTILVIFILLFLSFFSLRGVFIPVVGVIGSAVISMGVMAGLGIPFGHGTSIMPILIASIAVADSIHILRKYYLCFSYDCYHDGRIFVSRGFSDKDGYPFIHLYCPGCVYSSSLFNFLYSRDFKSH
jgi:predicted RND superfamily exporter protein